MVEYCPKTIFPAQSPQKSFKCGQTNLYIHLKIQIKLAGHKKTEVFFTNASMELKHKIILKQISVLVHWKPTIV
ncbi:hypothetical protein AD948_09665 [Acetobacter senegalensis]|uniref:Uncharacterized protein n=1 Tax=Acetobacter senegalensis TaxID=446692 RepID=A0A149U1A6_9PROT|nr:hypothetical protein AD948_09665 [Acetobacter senegalensis]